MASNGERFYCLQAWYAQKEGGDTADPEQVSYIAPFEKDKLQFLLIFVLSMAEAERTVRRAWVSNAISVTAAIIAAIAAVMGLLFDELSCVHGGSTTFRSSPRASRAGAITAA